MTLYTLYGNFIRHIGKSPYSLLGITALLLILAALLTRPDRVTDVHFHDSYFVVEDRVVYLCCAAIATITWLLYALTRQIRYVGALVWAHVILTWVLLVGGAVFWSAGGMAYITQLPRRYDDFYVGQLSEITGGILTVVRIVMAVLLCGPLLFIINFITGVVLLLKEKSRK